MTEPLPFWWLDFDLGFKIFICICHKSGHWGMQVVLAYFLTAYFAACWGIVCPGRTIKSLFYLIRKLLRHMNNRSVFQYISHRLIFQFYETSCSYLWVRFSEPVLDFKWKTTDVAGQMYTGFQKTSAPISIEWNHLLQSPTCLLLAIETLTSLVTEVYFYLILAIFSVRTCVSALFKFHKSSSFIKEEMKFNFASLIPFL